MTNYRMRCSRSIRRVFGRCESRHVSAVRIALVLALCTACSTVLSAQVPSSPKSAATQGGRRLTASQIDSLQRAGISRLRRNGFATSAATEAVFRRIVDSAGTRLVRGDSSGALTPDILQRRVLDLADSISGLVRRPVELTPTQLTTAVQQLSLRCRWYPFCEPVPGRVP